MKKLSNAFITILKPQIFAVVYLVWLCINMIAVINPLPFTRIFLALSAVWAAAVCVKQYFFSDAKKTSEVFARKSHFFT